MRFILFQVILLILLGSVFCNNSTEVTSIKVAHEVTVSGISSGGAMAAQMLVAFSSEISGAGLFAAPPYFWTRGAAVTIVDCMTTGISVFPDQIILAAEGFASLGLIDNLSNLASSKIYMFSGKKDTIVWTRVVKKNEDIFRKLGADVITDYSISAEHTFPTDFFGNEWSNLGKPYINNCDYKGSKHALDHILDDNLKPKVDYKEDSLKSFSQKKYKHGMTHSLADSGMIYVPKACENKECELHIAFHGCAQTINDIGLDYVYGTGFLGLAEANDLVILFPQIKTSKIYPLNPKGCWDWWGYSEVIPMPVQWSFPTNKGVQMRAIREMMKDLQNGRFEFHSEFAFKDILKSSY